MPINLDALATAAAGTAAPSLVPTPAVAQGPSAPMAFLDALAHHTGAFAHHAAQGVENGIAKVFPGFAPIAAQDEAALKQWEGEYKTRMANLPAGVNAAANAGAVVGEVAPWLVPTNLPAVGAKAAELVGPLTRLLPNAVQSATSAGVKRATEGAILGAGSSEGDGTATALGAAGAAALPPALKFVGRGVGNAYQYAKALMSPGSSAAGAVGELANRVNVDPAKVAELTNAPGGVTGPQQVPGQAGIPAAPTAVQLAQMTPQQRLAVALTANQSPVPGVKYTADQALAPVLGTDNTPVVQLTQAMRNSAGGANAFATREAENNAARLQYLQQFTKSPAELDALVKDRRAFAQQYMGTVGPDGTYTPGSINAPVPVGSVLSHMENLGQTNFSTDPIIARTLDRLKADIAAKANPDGTIRPDLLDGIRQNLRTTIADNAGSAAVSTTKQEAGLQPVADTIVGAIEAANPGYRDYLAQYAARSAPINTGQAANGLLSSVSGRLGKGANNAAGDTQLTLPAISGALNEVSNLPHGVTPEFQTALENVQRDLQNSSVSNAKMGAPGSPTEYYGNLSGQVGDAINGKLGIFQNPVVMGLAGAAGLADGVMTGGIGTGAAHGITALLGLGGASKMGGARLQQGYVDMLMNPDKLAQALVDISPQVSNGRLANYLSTLPVVGSP